MDSPTSDAPRQSLLGSINFLARSNRPRAATTSNSTNAADSPAAPTSHPPQSTPGHRRRPAAANPPAAQISASNPSGLGYMLRRRRSGNALPDRSESRVESAAVGPTHRIRLVPHLESHRSLHFEAISRDVRQGDSPLRIGRFTDRSAHSAHNGNKLAFKSKVVSRGHAEVWFDSGSFYIKDTKSSSGTFLNHIRLSSPNTESRPYPIKDGDVLQLGVDYQGGTEEIYRCVKMRVELGREWQAGVNAFNSNALSQLKTLSGAGAVQNGSRSGPIEKRTKSNLTDCCICLFQVTVCQSLFIAPCSHVYHYKCIRPLLEMHHPGFSCPLCRTFADLEADVEVENRDVEPVVEEDVEMESGDVADFQMRRETDGQLDDEQSHELHDGDVVEADEGEDGDGDHTSSSIDSPRPLNDSNPSPIPVLRQGSMEPSGFASGAEASPLEGTFLATLVSGTRREGHVTEMGPSAIVSGAGVGAIMSDEGDSAEEATSGVGEKRKR